MNRREILLGLAAVPVAAALPFNNAPIPTLSEEVAIWRYSRPPSGFWVWEYYNDASANIFKRVRVPLERLAEIAGWNDETYAFNLRFARRHPRWYARERIPDARLAT